MNRNGNMSFVVCWFCPGDIVFFLLLIFSSFLSLNLWNFPMQIRLFAFLNAFYFRETFPETAVELYLLFEVRLSVTCLIYMMAFSYFQYCSSSYSSLSFNYFSFLTSINSFSCLCCCWKILSWDAFSDNHWVFLWGFVVNLVITMDFPIILP